MQEIKDIPISYAFYKLKEGCVNLKDAKTVIDTYGSDESDELNDIIENLDKILEKMDIERKRWTF